MAVEKPRFEVGTTFLLDAGGSHLWVILSDPQADPEQVVIVSLTSWHARKDQSCIIERGEHEWATHRTCVLDAKAMIVTEKQIFDGRNKGLLKIQERMSAEVLKRIWRGAAQSEHFAPANLTILRNQGLVE